MNDGRKNVPDFCCWLLAVSASDIGFSEKPTNQPKKNKTTQQQQQQLFLNTKLELMLTSLRGTQGTEHTTTQTG